MLQSPVTLASTRFALTEHFLRAYGDPPWQIIAGGRERSFTVKTLPALMKWIGEQQTANRNVFAPLPTTGGNLWHIALRVPLEFRPAECRFPPSLTIVTDEYHLLWRVNEPMKARLAKILAERLAKEIGGVPALDAPIPVPGTILFREVGARLTQRFPVQMMPAMPTAYKIVDGELKAEGGQIGSDPFMRADLVEARALEWLWPGFIPLGALTLLGGAAGMGKSQVAIALAATVSSAGAWPTGEKAEKGSALVLEAEDDVERTVVPRLLAAGADLKRIGLGKVVDLSESIELLEAEARRRSDLRLVVLSPIRKFMGKAELHGNLGVRAVLDPLLAWAESRGVTILGIAHPEKGKEHKEAFAGSAAFLEVARAAYSVIPDPADKNPIIKQKRRLMVAAKNNLGSDDVTLRYTIEGVRVEEIETSAVSWLPY